MLINDKQDSFCLLLRIFRSTANVTFPWLVDRPARDSSLGFISVMKSKLILQVKVNNDTKHEIFAFVNKLLYQNPIWIKIVINKKIPQIEVFQMPLNCSGFFGTYLRRPLIWSVFGQKVIAQICFQGVICRCDF